MPNVSKYDARRREAATYWVDAVIWVGILLIVAYWVTWLGILTVAALGALVLRRQCVRHAKAARREQRRVWYPGLRSSTNGPCPVRSGLPALQSLAHYPAHPAITSSRRVG